MSFDPADEDTGPVRIPPTATDDDWDQPRAQDTWARRFDAPLTVSPRVHTRRTLNVPLLVVGGVVAVAVVGGLVFWLLRPSVDESESADAAPTTSVAPTTSADDQRLQGLLPAGYTSESCDAVAAPENVLAQTNCTENADGGGPVSATYTLAGDKEALDAAFNSAIGSAHRVNCPGNIQSPGPWRRNAAPHKVAGTLFCGLREGQPTVIWTDDADLTLNAVRTGPGGPTFPELYTWWASHS